jgi:hypothetical protein
VTDEEYWKDIEVQIERVRSKINIHQEQRLFFIELIIAIIGFGLLLNLLTSIVYDVLIKQEQARVIMEFHQGQFIR